MSDISAIDSNFKVETNIKQDDLRFYDPKQAPFQIYGVYYEDGKFRRLPEEVAKTVNSGVLRLHANTAGGRVRFQTDSPYVAIHTKMSGIGKMSHFPLTGSAGFDLYAKAEDEPERYRGTFTPPFAIVDGYESVLHFESAKMREITVNMPLYSEVTELYIGLQEDAVVLPPRPYKIETPIVYYGSSITQGGCASRPGNAYQSAISRRLDADYVNLGFSGSARGEVEIAEYVAGLSMSAFVYDYDHNAPTPEHLQNTHERMFLAVREAHPDIPIVLMSRPRAYLNQEDQQRLAIITATYENAKNRGDQNVYLLTGPELMADAGYDGNVDGTHPTDLGFASMARALGDLLERIVKDPLSKGDS